MQLPEPLQKERLDLHQVNIYQRVLCQTTQRRFACRFLAIINLSVLKQMGAV